MTKKFLIALIVVLISLPAFAQYVAQDPTRYIPNARVLGLGKAYIGLADDAGAIYTNPAGLVETGGWQLSSMSGKFLDEYTYLSFSGLYATNVGVFGVGFAGTSISGAWATTIEAGSDPADPIYTIDPSQPQMGNYNNAFVLSYANRLAKINFLNRLPLADRLDLGANLKLFQVALYGDGIVGGNASGYELDAGLKLKPPQPWMKFGVTAQNLLPASLGGKLSYASGHEEAYPAVLEAGSAFHILGREKALREFRGQELKLMLDFDMHPTLKDYPLVWHAGAEWNPIPMLALRAGLDQDTAGDGAGGLVVVSDPTYGVGLRYGGFSFDYAYHAFTGAPNIDNHFFSFAYAFEPVKAEIPEEAIVVEQPADRLITFKSRVGLAGRAVDRRVRKLFIDGKLVKFTLKGDFQAVVDLKVGKNLILIEGKGGGGKAIGSKKLRVLRLVMFPDVAAGYWVDKPVSLLAMQNIITGYPDGTFRPEGNITRAEMTTLLIKSKTQNSKLKTDEKLFKDVSEKHWAAPYIAQAATDGVVKGYPDGTFGPKKNITRAEGLAMIARFAGVSKEAYTNQFPDVAGAYWAAPIISGAYNAGLLEYLKGRAFQPRRLLTRAETVEMLRRTQTVKDLLAKDLLNWETY